MLDPKDLLQEAMKLPPRARAALAGSLLESLDDQIDTDAAASWELEIQKRLAEIEGDQVRMVPWSEARKQIAK